MSRYRFPRALELLCACLSAGQRGRRLDPDAAATLADPSTDLVRLARLAGRHRVTPMLAACIADPELRQRLPEDFSLYLEFIHVENARRNRALRLQLAQVAACLNGIGIEPILLKGAIRLVDGLYPDLGWRFMRDLDLLIPGDRLREAVACLESLGYRFVWNAGDLVTHRKHLPPLILDGTVAVIEIHTDLPGLREILRAQDVLARSRTIDVHGARARVPDVTDQLGHLMAHDRFDAELRMSGLFLLRSVFEAALLCQEECVRRKLLARFASTPLARYLRIRIDLMARLFPDYLRRPLDVRPHESLLACALIGLERLEENGGLRRLTRFFGYGRSKLGNLLASPLWRKRFATKIRSPEYRLHCMQQLRRAWTGD